MPTATQLEAFGSRPSTCRSGPNQENNTGSGFCFLFGSFLPFDEAKLAELYPTHGNYVSQVTQAAKASVKAGFLLEEDAEQLRTEAAQSDIGR